MPSGFRANVGSLRREVQGSARVPLALVRLSCEQKSASSGLERAVESSEEFESRLGKNLFLGLWGNLGVNDYALNHCKRGGMS